MFYGECFALLEDLNTTNSKNVFSVPCFVRNQALTIFFKREIFWRRCIPLDNLFRFEFSLDFRKYVIKDHYGFAFQSSVKLIVMPQNCLVFFAFHCAGCQVMK